MNEVDAYSRGIVKDRNRLYWQDFKRMPSPVPPVEEQRHIARFLDAVGGKARRFIRNKRRLIDLLKEQKQNIINQAVTRGLDPNVRLKSSGVEWIGDIPEHWEVRRLKQFAKIQTGVTLGPIGTYKGLVERPYLRVANVQNGLLDLDNVKTVFVPIHEIPSRELKYGDVLMTEGGDMDKLGRGCVWRNEIEGCLHQNHVFSVRTNKDVLSPEYLVRLMESRHGRTYFELTAKRTTNLASTNSSTLGCFPIPLPPLNEQYILLEQLLKKSTKIDQAITRAQREIELMREYRTRLIADVVNGQVDVRGIEVPEVAEAEVDASSPLQDEDTAEADDLLDADGEVEAGE
jgi:type I restriction enzyme S subunit